MRLPVPGGAFSIGRVPIGSGEKCFYDSIEHFVNRNQIPEGISIPGKRISHEFQKGREYFINLSIREYPDKPRII